MKLLLISDSEQIKLRLKEVLKENAPSFEIFEKKLGQSGLMNDIKKIDPNAVLILLNYSSMSKLNEFKTIKIIHPEITLILYCYYGCHDQKDMQNEIQADYYLEKPSGLEKIYKILKDLKSESYELV
jgi:DNA-binding NarL/FixJ family response regulator